MKTKSIALLGAVTLLSFSLATLPAFARGPLSCTGTAERILNNDPTQKIEIVKCIEVSNGVASAAVKNTGSAPVRITLVSYEKYDETLENQKLFQADAGADGLGNIVPPGETKALQVTVPSCSTQIDLVFGRPILQYAPGVRYCLNYPSDCRLIDDLHTNLTYNPSNWWVTGLSSTVPYCQSCASVDIKGTQFNLDVLVASLRNNNRRIARAYRDAAKLAGVSTSSQKKISAEATQLEAKSQELYQTGWTAAYTKIPGVVLTCAPSNFCVSTSTASATNTIKTSELGLVQIGESTAKKVQSLLAKAKRSSNRQTKAKATALSKRITGVVARNQKLAAEGEVLRAGIPATVSSCN